MQTRLRTFIAVVLASATLPGCSDRPDDDGIETAGDGDEPETPDDTPAPDPDDDPLVHPDPDAECAHPANTGSTVWLCSDELPEPYNREPRCLWSYTMEQWTCFNHPCAQGTKLGTELGLDPDIWVCERVYVHKCTFDQFGEEEPFDCPAECEIEDYSMTCPDFECSYSPNRGTWLCD